MISDLYYCTAYSCQNCKMHFVEDVTGCWPAKTFLKFMQLCAYAVVLKNSPLVTHTFAHWVKPVTTTTWSSTDTRSSSTLPSSRKAMILGWGLSEAQPNVPPPDPRRLLPSQTLHQCIILIWCYQFFARSAHVHLQSCMMSKTTRSSTGTSRPEKNAKSTVDTFLHFSNYSSSFYTLGPVCERDHTL